MTFTSQVLLQSHFPKYLKLNKTKCKMNKYTIALSSILYLVFFTIPTDHKETTDQIKIDLKKLLAVHFQEMR